MAFRGFSALGAVSVAVPIVPFGVTWSCGRRICALGSGGLEDGRRRVLGRRGPVGGCPLGLRPHRGRGQGESKDGQGEATDVE